MKRTITEASRGPKYAQIGHDLISRINQRTLTEGDYLPATDELARSYKVSIGTMKRALQMLHDQNLIESRRGHGTKITLPALQAPRAGRSVVVLLSDIRRTFFAEIYSGIQSVLSECNCEPVLLETGESSDVEGQLLEKYEANAKGFILFPEEGKANYQRFARLLSKNIPMVFVDHYPTDFRVDSVLSDNRSGGYLATRHLLDLGHKRIGVLTWEGKNSVKHRLEGWRKAMQEAGLPAGDDLILKADKGGYEAAYELAGRQGIWPPDLTAIFCTRDDSAWGIIQRLGEKKVRIPGDISVVGYDDNDDICSRIRPRLTTIRQNRREMGELAARMLVRHLDGDDLEPETVSLPVELIVRDSTAAPRRSK